MIHVLKALNPLDCSNPYKAVAGGALTALLGVDTVFMSAGLPPGVHHALAGYATDAYCGGGVTVDSKQAAMCALGGFVGGFGMMFLQSRGVPFTGPFLSF